MKNADKYFTKHGKNLSDKDKPGTEGRMHSHVCINPTQDNEVKIGSKMIPL